MSCFLGWPCDRIRPSHRSAPRSVAALGDLGYNAGVYLAADYTPEFDSFKERLLELAQIRSVAELLRHVVTRLVEPPYVALARIWFVDKGDLCSSCCMRPA